MHPRQENTSIYVLKKTYLVKLQKVQIHYIHVYRFTYAEGFEEGEGDADFGLQTIAGLRLLPFLNACLPSFLMQFSFFYNEFSNFVPLRWVVSCFVFPAHNHATILANSVADGVQASQEHALLFGPQLNVNGLIHKVGSTAASMKALTHNILIMRKMSSALRAGIYPRTLQLHERHLR